MEFAIVRMFIDVIRDYTIFHGWDIKWKKNHIKGTAICKQKGVHEIFLGVQIKLNQIVCKSSNWSQKIN